ncbi:hypothetical protein [Altererythrobacter sp. MF3-039]|uniref:hypothetical protein n=1 Tax=Altererythrobacter sp. MF3-039 TaxID=3252901 RepID=UPI00390CAB24
MNEMRAAKSATLAVAMLCSPQIVAAEVSDVATSCVLDGVPTEFREVLARAADNRESSPPQPTSTQVDEFVSVARECARLHNVKDEFLIAWGEYLFAAIFLEEAEKHLSSDGLNIQQVRAASDFLFDEYGLTKIPQNNAAALLDELMRRGIDSLEMPRHMILHLSAFHAARRAQRTKLLALR